MLFKFIDVYTELPQTWLLKAGIISSWENMRKHQESASRQQTSGKGLGRGIWEEKYHRKPLKTKRKQPVLN